MQKSHACVCRPQALQPIENTRQSTVTEVLQLAPHSRTHAQTRKKRKHKRTHIHTHTATARTHARTYARNSCLGTCPARKFALRKLLCASALYNLLCASCAVQVALRELRCGSCSVQAALRKLLCASCSAQVARRKLLGTSVLLCASCSTAHVRCLQVALRKLLCASCSAQVLPKLRDCALRTRFVLEICDFAAGAAGLYRVLKNCDFGERAAGMFSAYYFRMILQPELGECTPRTTFVLKICEFCSWSYKNVLRVLFLYLKFTILQLELRVCTPRTTFVLKICDFQLKLRNILRVLLSYLKIPILQPELPRTRRGSNPRPRDSKSSRANHETTAKDHFASKKRVVAPRSPQRVAQAPQKTQKTSTSSTPIPAEGSSGHRKYAKKPRVFAPRPRRSPQRVDPRRGSHSRPRPLPRKRFVIPSSFSFFPAR